MELGERGDPSMAVLHYLREEKGISAEVNLWKRGRGAGREKKLPFIGRLVTYKRDRKRKRIVS